MAAVATALVALSVYGLTRSSRGVTLKPFPAPQFDLPELREPSRRVRLGEGPVLVNFFDSTCLTCIREMPVLQKIADRGNVRVIGIDLLDRRAAALRLIQKTGITYPVAFDEQGATVDTYRVLRLPTTVAIDASGRVIAVRYIALTDASAASLESQLRRPVQLP